MDILQNKKHRGKVQGWLSLSYWNTNILLLYIFTMPFVSAFSVTGTLSLPLFFGVFLFALMCMFIVVDGKFPKGFIGIDILIISLFFFVVLFSYLVNGLGSQKSLNHTIAFFSTFLLFYVAVKFALFKAEDKQLLYKQVLLFITYTTILSGLFGFIEFISVNAFNLNLNDYIPRPSADEKAYNASVIGLFTRTRGFASESGAFTQMMELFTPLAIYYMFFSSYCKWRMWLKLTLVVIITFSVIFAASSATFIVVPIAIAISILIYFKKIILYLSRKSPAFFLKTAAAFSVILFISDYFSIYANIVWSITDKADSSSFDDREERMNFFYSMFFKSDFVGKLIGRGPAASEILGFGSGSSILSLYHGTTFQLGILGLLLISLLLIYIFIAVIALQSKLGFFLLITFLSGVAHYYIMNNYWVPWFWFLGAFAVYCNSLNNSANKKKWFSYFFNQETKH